MCVCDLWLVEHFGSLVYTLVISFRLFGDLLLFFLEGG